MPIDYKPIRVQTGEGGWPIRVPVHLDEQPPTLCPTVVRSRAGINPQLRALLNKLVTGRSPWPLTLLGGVGSGKTCAALSLLDSIRARGGCFYQTQGSLYRVVQSRRFDHLRDRFGAPITEQSWWGCWSQAAFTVLDEINAPPGSPGSGALYREYVQTAIDERQGKVAVYISNMIPKSDKWELAEVLDDRIASRLSAGTVVILDDSDRRQPAG